MERHDRDGDGNRQGDLLYGASAIAEAVGLTRRQIYHAAEASNMPLFRIGAIICARRTGLERWFARQEAMAEKGLVSGLLRSDDTEDAQDGTASR